MLDSIEAGSGLVNAIVHHVSVGTRVSLVEGRALVSQITLLLLDGFDECGDSLSEIARELESILTGWSSLRLVVATRPGSALRLPDAFRRAQVLPVADDDLESFIRGLPGIDLGHTLDHKTLSALVRRALDTAGLVPYPLYLGALVQIVQATSTLPRTRAELFKQLMDILQTRSVNDRPGVQVATVVRSRVLKAAGLLQAEASTISMESIAKLVAQASGTRAPILDADAEKSVNFWHERGVLLKAMIEGRECFEFVHGSLAAFAGAGELIEQQRDARLALMRRLRDRDEVFSFAAELGGPTIVDEIFSCTQGEVCDDFLLRIKCVLSVEIPAPAWLKAISVDAEPLLSSTIPVIVTETALAIAPLAPHASVEFRRAVARMSDTSGAWNHLARLLITVLTHDKSDDLSELKRALTCCAEGAPLIEGSTRDTASERRLWSAIVLPTLEILKDGIERSEFVKLVKMLTSGSPLIDFYAHQQLIQRLPDWDMLDSLPESFVQLLMVLALVVGSGHEPIWRADMSFLRAVEAVVGPMPVVAGTMPSPNAGKSIAMLMAGCGFPSSTMEGCLSHDFESASIGTGIIKSLIYALELDESTLRREISEFRAAWPDPPTPGREYLAIISEAGKLPVSVRWYRAAQMSPPVDALLDGIESLNDISMGCAIQLLLHHQDLIRLKERIERALPSLGEAHVAILQRRGMDLFGDSLSEVLFLILDRNLNETTCVLIHELARIRTSRPRLFDVIRKALGSGCPQIVRHAARCASECSGEIGLTGELRATLKRWLAWESEGISLQKLTAGSVICGTSLYLPEVYNELFIALVSDKAITWDELLGWATDPCVGYMGGHELAARAALSRVDAIRFLDDVRGGRLGAAPLTHFIAKGAAVLTDIDVENAVLNLATHPEPSIRQAITGSLGSAVCGTEERRRAVLTGLLEDPVPSIRTAAENTLRLLKRV